jgi:hypothetical protein
MNLIDFLIIYLACGAPFGVYFFLQNRKKFSVRKLWLKSFLTVFVWIPYAFNLLHHFTTKKIQTRQKREKALLDERLAGIQKLILDLHFESSSKISSFEIREVFERYAGLTMVCNFENNAPSQTEKEIFRISLRQNPELGASCLHRRNRERLLLHQIQARKDFLQIIRELMISVFDTDELRNLVIEFVETIGDFEAQNLVKESLLGTLQNDSNSNVQQLENEVWKSNEHKPLPIKTTPVHLQVLTATATPKKD